MKKIRLTVESLKVLSFETDHPAGRHGTVRGAQTLYGRCPDDVDYQTNYDSCIVRPYTGDDPNQTCVDGCLGC